jgi:hypothetical protein
MLADKQLPSNIDQGGIIVFDCDNLELPEFHEESHQIHILRPLSDAEALELDRLNEDECGAYCERNAILIDGKIMARAWIDCMALNDAARTYLLSLRA